MTLSLMAAWNLRGFNSPDKVPCCKQFSKKYNLDMLFILEAKVSAASSSDPWFSANHDIFPCEASFDNFALSNPDTIWIKWNSLKVNFIPVFTSTQLIHELVYVGTIPTCNVSVIYASKNFEERLLLWEQLLSLADGIVLPGIILGDFNCCRYPHEKAGGNAIVASKMTDFNNLIFNIGVHELSSVGHYYTWFNQRADKPIHIKLDRALVNDAWLSTFNNTYFWDCLISSFSQHYRSSPICAFYYKLKDLKRKIKTKTWASSSRLKQDLDNLSFEQNLLLSRLQDNPTDPILNATLSFTNRCMADINHAWTEWISQRGKASWLSCGEDDLKFLYARINIRHNVNLIKSLSTPDGILTSHQEIKEAAISHFQNLFNSSTLAPNASHSIPTGNSISVDLIQRLTSPVTAEEIKSIIFNAPATSAPGPDGYTFDFYKSSWNVIGKQICDVVFSFFSSGFMPREAKATAITLIPKKTHADCISDYIPISLCNTFLQNNCEDSC
ncbi:uncharacterized protein LOC110104846 [Dendrobium catenatum]|uniref:uncharacterized protein LOC110104846 n=1 Tax=Dendrobium catenatum TaxID=906689 RepID=UPI0009F1A6DA|nr:uncharacterized protein LOC110104846 [Dendrobium catenatum]